MVGYDPLTGSLPERYDVQALLGHEDYATAQRYAHLAPDAHDKVIES
jgi:site-specific recombinase XerD